MSYKKLSKEEVNELIIKAQQGDEEAKTQLYESFKRFIYKIVHKINPSKQNFEDYFQFGCVGFLKAVRDFKPELGFNFTTYMEPKVRGEIIRFIRDGGGGSSLKFSRSIKEIGRSVIKLSNENGLSYHEIIASLDLEKEIENEVYQFLMPTASLQSVVNSNHADSDKIKLEDTIPLENSEDKILENLINLDLQEILTDDEKEIFDLRYIKGLTQWEIGQIKGASQVKISRKEKIIKKKLAEYFGYDENITRPKLSFKKVNFNKKEGKQIVSNKFKQAAYILKTYPDLKQKDIASIIGVTAGTVSNYAKRMKMNEIIEVDSSIEPKVQEYISKFYPNLLSSPVKVTKIKDLPEEKVKYVGKEENTKQLESEVFQTTDKQENLSSMLPKTESKKMIQNTNFTFAGNGDTVKTLSNIYLSEVFKLIDKEDEVEIKIKVNIK